MAAGSGRDGIGLVFLAADGISAQSFASLESNHHEHGLGSGLLRFVGFRVPTGPRREIASFTSNGIIESFIPLFMFSVLFGLSMDYEVFLLARIREEFQRTGDTTEAVGWGLEHTGRIITGAAAVMVTVFGAFAFASLVPIKAMGFGLAAAVFLDATIIRIIMVPATMRLVGNWNWWLPQWLDDMLPVVSAEGGPSPATPVLPGIPFPSWLPEYLRTIWTIFSCFLWNVCCNWPGEFRRRDGPSSAWRPRK